MPGSGGMSAGMGVPQRPSFPAAVPFCQGTILHRTFFRTVFRSSAHHPMTTLRLLIIPTLAVLQAAGAAEPPPLRVRAQTIDPAIQIGYGLAIADVDGDGKDDVLLADAKQIVWYRAPQWEKFIMAENLTARDNVCIAARDLDGDKKCEVAVGAEWNPSDTVNSGAVFFLEPPADRTQRWTAKKLPHEPTTHRMLWVRGLDRGYMLAVLPLHGRGNKNGAGEGVQLLGYEWPWGAASRPVPMWSHLPPLHLTHNFDLLPQGQGGNAVETLLRSEEHTSELQSQSNL